jgi:hypothetical protein
MATEKKTASKKAVAKKTEAAPTEMCSVKTGDKACKRPYRAKGMCVTHYKMWRRNELEGHKGRYKVCSKEGCRKPRVGANGSLCVEHGSKADPAEAAA